MQQQKQQPLIDPDYLFARIHAVPKDIRERLMPIYWGVLAANAKPSA